MLEPGSDEIRKIYRLTDDHCVMLNNGSFGRAPNPVIERRMSLLQEQEANPGLFFRVENFKYYDECVEVAAKFVGADPEDLFVIDNATTGTNCILKSLKFEPGSKILLNNHTFNGVQNTAAEVEQFQGLERHCIQFPFPMQDEEEIIDLYEKHLEENPSIKIAVIDHITSESAILMPIHGLIKVCKKHDVIVVIDGAHAPGQVSLDMNEIGADFYVGNFHKWLGTSKGCAFMWISPPYKGQILPLVTSYFQKTFRQRFCFLGTRDFTPFFTLPTAIDFYENVVGGLKQARSHAEKMIQWAVPMLRGALGTTSLDIPSRMRAPCMALIKLPELPDSLKKLTVNDVMAHLMLQYNIQVAIYTFSDAWWLRISVGVYNNKADYFKLRDVLLDLLEIKHKL